MAIEVFPSRTTTIKARTDEVKLTTENCKIILPKKINKLEKVYCIPSMQICFYYNEVGTGTQFQVTADIGTLYTDAACTQSCEALDISKYVVEYDKYKTLYTLSVWSGYSWGELYTNNAWYYVHNTNEINIADERPILFAEKVSTHIIHFTLYDLSVASGVLYYKPSGASSYIGTVTTAYIKTATLTPSSYLTYRWQVHYEPFNEQMKIKVAKELPLENQFEIPYSQQQQIVSSQAFGKNMQATTNRMGVESRIVLRKIDDLTKFREIGSVWKDTQGTIWRLTANNITTKSGYLICEEIWAKNWSMQSEYVGINREFRSWNIPNDIVESNKFYEDWCYLTTNSNLQVTDDSILTSTAKQYIAKAPIDTTADTEITQMFLLNSYGNGAVVGATAFGYGNQLVFNSRTKDNLSAGIQRQADDDAYCTDVYYAGDSGEQTSLYITMSTDMANANSSQYPAVTTTMNNPSGTKLFDNVQFLVNKSSAEQINLTYQCNLIDFENEIVIGAGWANNCPLVNGNQQTRKFYSGCQNIPKGCQTMVASWGTVTTEASVITFDSTTSSITIQANSCVTDTNNAIIIANNSSSAKTIYIRFTHDIDALYAKYKELYDSTYRDAT